MAEFGRRGAGAARPGMAARSAGPTPVATPEAMAAAAEAIAKGKMPVWTNAGPVKNVIFALSLLGVLFYIAYAYGGGLLRDHRFSGTWQPAYDLQATGGHCRRVQLLLTFCSANITSLAESEKAPAGYDALMGFVSGGGERLDVMRSTRDPSAVTIAYFAENELANRTVTFLLVELGCVAAIWSVALSLRRGRYKGGAQHLQLLAALAALQARMDREAAPPLREAA